jgi:hypothetical protein
MRNVVHVINRRQRHPAVDQRTVPPDGMLQMTEM